MPIGVGDRVWWMKTNSEISIPRCSVTVSRDEFVEAMSFAANSVNVVTTISGGERHGLTVSAATSVTAEPPALLACVNQESPAAEAILESRVLCLNVLTQSQREVATVFAQRDVDRRKRFEVGQWSTLVTGAPALEEALSCFDCRVVSAQRIGTHYVFIAVVEATRIQPGEPLVYTRRRYARLDPD